MKDDEDHEGRELEEEQELEEHDEELKEVKTLIFSPIFPGSVFPHSFSSFT